MATPARSTPAFRFGPFVLDAVKGELRKSDIPLKLHPQPFRLLVLLVERSGQIVTREEIQKSLWGNHTWVDFDGGINFCIRQIRSVLGDDAEQPRYIETVPRSGYRFIFPLTQAEPREQVIPISRAPLNQERRVEQGQPPTISLSVPDLQVLPRHLLPAREITRGKRIVRIAIPVATVLLVAAAGFLYFTFRGKPKLTDKDTVMIADLRNTTGDSVFDEALRQGLVVELGQSPFLNILSDKKASDTLRMMGRSPEESHLAPDVSREVCVRSGSKALVSGSIWRLGTHYVVGLDAILCSSGDILASERAEASRKEDILKALNGASSKLRRKLGESLPSLQKFDVPVEATTSSLEALRLYSLSGKIARQQGELPSLPLMLRAVELDPNFAMAYYGLARRYNNLDEPSLTLHYATKAYELRDRVTEQERLLISLIYLRSIGDLDKLQQLFAEWSAIYPRSVPHESLGTSYVFLGDYQQAFEELAVGLRNDPDTVTNYENLAGALLALNRLSEAKVVLDQAASHNLSSSDLHQIGYHLAFLQNDARKMESQLSLVSGQFGIEDRLLAAQADTEAFYGRLESARSFSARAIDSSTRADLSEVAGLWQALTALREAQFGVNSEAKSVAESALARAPGRHVKFFAALALAIAGDVPRAQDLAVQLEQENPSNTAFKLHRLPSLQAAIALQQRNPGRALKILEAARPYELGQPSPTPLGTLFVPYLSGQAFLMEHNGKAAGVEFKKILDHPGIALNFPVGALARLQLARAQVIQGDVDAARTSYEDFFALWKDADPDIPILRHARAEYAELH